MADLVYLSLWLRDYGEANMLPYWMRVIAAFPASSEAPGIRSLSVYPFDWSETPVFERSFGEDTTAEDVANLAAEFLHEDYAYEVEMSWDLWLPDPAPESGGWRRSPMSVSIACMGTKFDADNQQDHPNILINFGLDTPFLPPEEEVLFKLGPDFDADQDIADVRTRDNLQQLVGFVHQLDQTLPISKRVLWCESGENLAEKIMEAWNMGL